MIDQGNVATSDVVEMEKGYLPEASIIYVLLYALISDNGSIVTLDK